MLAQRNIGCCPPHSISKLTLFYCVTLRASGTSPERYGFNMGHAGNGSNWLTFMDRSGINYARFFVGTVSGDLRTQRGSRFGQALDGTPVNSIGAYKKAVAQLRSPAGAYPCEVLLHMTCTLRASFAPVLLH